MSRAGESHHLHDWPRIIAEIEASGLSPYKLALQLGVDPTTVRHWQADGEPKHINGTELLRIHAERVEKPL